MTHYHRLGQLPHKRHTQFRQPDGSLYHEEVMGLRGFSGNRSLLYHLRPPTDIREVQRGECVTPPRADQGPLRPRLLHTGSLPQQGDAIEGRVPLLENDTVAISVVRPATAMSYWYRSAQGDDVLFVHEGTGTLETQYGTLTYGRGDYLVIPTGVLWRLVPDQGTDQRMLVVECSGGHIEAPRRYLSPSGQLLESAPYSERDIRPPDRLETRDERGEFEVRVRARGAITRFRYAYHPLDVVGWDGYLWPFAFNIGDFEPITGRVHQPPPVHQTFEGPGFVLCSFVPRLFDYHPLAIPAPYNHSNVDSDEVIYYVDGQFMSRRHIVPGAMSVHPCGIPHGPHPGAYEGSIGKTRTDELAVMIDTFRPLALTAQAASLEDEAYAYSWRSPVPDV